MNRQLSLIRNCPFLHLQVSKITSYRGGRGAGSRDQYIVLECMFLVYYEVKIPSELGESGNPT